MKQLQAWTNDASMESKMLAALAKRSDLEAAQHDSSFTAGLRARSSNLGGFASRSSSMASLAGHQDHATEHYSDHPADRHRQAPRRPTGCCLAAIGALLLLLGVVLLLKQRARLAAVPVVTIAAQRQPASAARVTAEAVTAGLSKAGRRCAQLCLAEANQRAAKQPDITEGARGLAFDGCFSRCAANSPADTAEGGALSTRRNRKVAAGGLVAGVTGGQAGVLARAGAPAQDEHRQ